MKIILASITAIGLALAAPAAFAADPDNDHHGHHDNGHHDNDDNDNDHHDNDHNDNHHGHHNRGHGHVNVNLNIGVHAGWAKFHANVHSPRRYHWAAYHHPHGWYKHRWVFNERLPAAFFVSDYYISDYGQFGLMAPDEGLVWVRYDNDALLIDRDTGTVVRVVYDVFE